MKRYDFPAVLNNLEEGVSITFPDLPGCQTFSDMRDMAGFMAKDTLQRYLEQLKAGAFEIPVSSPVDPPYDSHVIIVTAWV